MDEGRAALAPAEPDHDPSVTLSMDQEAFWRLGFGRVEPERVLATGEVRIEGRRRPRPRVLDSMAFMI